MKITVVRFALYPDPEPTGYVVGFSVESIGGKSFYTDTMVLFDDCKNKNEKEIIDIAYNSLKTNITAKCRDFDTTPGVLGSEYIPN